RRLPSPASRRVTCPRTPILYQPDWPCTVARSAPATRTNASVRAATTRRGMENLLARGRSARRLWRTPPCITASRGVSRQAAPDGGRLLCVSDDHGHHVLAPASIRFFLLCGSPLAPAPVPRYRRGQQMSWRC